MRIAEFKFINRTHGDYFLHWYYECPCGKLYGEVKHKSDIKRNRPFYWAHACGGLKIYLYHFLKPIFKFGLFLPFLFLWSYWTNTPAITNMGFLIYSVVVSIPLYVLYDRWFKKWRA